MKVIVRAKGKVENKIIAIKCVRYLAGIGLKDAKNFVESVMTSPHTAHDLEILPKFVGEHGGVMRREIQPLLDQNIDVSPAVRRRTMILEANKAAVRMALDDRDYDLARDLVDLLKKHDEYV